MAHSEAIAREGLMQVLTGQGVEISAAPTTIRDLLLSIQQTNPQVVVIGHRFADGDVLHALQELRIVAPRLPVLIYMPFEEAIWISRAVSLGAAGLLLGTDSGSDMVEKLRAAASGESIWRRDQLRRVPALVGPVEVNDDPYVHLTPREHDVLVELCKGSTNRQIAELLGISYETVKEHVQHLLQKIFVDDRTQAAVWAVRRGLDVK
ncbi:MAG: response regulator transcription factor [Pirellulaceae bacterium]